MSSPHPRLILGPDDGTAPKRQACTVLQFKLVVAAGVRPFHSVSHASPANPFYHFYHGYIHIHIHIHCHYHYHYHFHPSINVFDLAGNSVWHAGKLNFPCFAFVSTCFFFDFGPLYELLIQIKNIPLFFVFFSFLFHHVCATDDWGIFIWLLLGGPLGRSLHPFINKHRPYICKWWACQVCSYIILLAYKCNWIHLHKLCRLVQISLRIYRGFTNKKFLSNAK